MEDPAQLYREDFSSPSDLKPEHWTVVAERLVDPLQELLYVSAPERGDFGGLTRYEYAKSRPKLNWRAENVDEDTMVVEMEAKHGDKSAASTRIHLSRSRNYSITKIESFMLGKPHGVREIEYTNSIGSPGFPDVPSRIRAITYAPDGTMERRKDVEVLEFEEITMPDEFFTAESLAEELIQAADAGGVFLQYSHRDATGREELRFRKAGRWQEMPIVADGEKGQPIFDPSDRMREEPNGPPARRIRYEEPHTLRGGLPTFLVSIGVLALSLATIKKIAEGNALRRRQSKSA